MTINPFYSFMDKLDRDVRKLQDKKNFRAFIKRKGKKIRGKNEVSKL